MCNIEAYFSDVYMFICDLYFDVSGYVALDGWLVDVRIWNEEVMVEVLSGHLAGGTEKIAKSRVVSVSAEVQTEHFPCSIRSVV
jgi:hypothetical protein